MKVPAVSNAVANEQTVDKAESRCAVHGSDTTMMRNELLPVNQ